MGTRVNFFFGGGMGHKIFISHNSKDKPVVEPVALRLAEIFGQENVFYDSWSIKPGEGIIDQMNKGLEAPEFVFFFVSANSLNSGMVRLEWQNALYTATKGNLKIIPVRIDGADMPAVLKQTLYIDMHTIGLEAAIAQIVNVAQGNASFTPQHQGFSNLAFSRAVEIDGSVVLTIRASHLMEPNAGFMFPTENNEGEFSIEVIGTSGYSGSFNKDFFTRSDGKKVSGMYVKPMNLTLTPSHPMRFKFTKNGTSAISILGVFHEKAENQWVSVPQV